MLPSYSTKKTLDSTSVAHNPCYSPHHITHNPPSFLQRNRLKFLILDAPNDKNIVLYLNEFQRYKVTDLVRTCSLTYTESILLKHGIQIHALMFDDGEPPSKMILDKWMDIVYECARKDAVVAVHCLAGLGRAPVLVVVALIEDGMKNLEAVEFVRAHRRGAINKKQLEYLMSYKKRTKKTGCCFIM